jgi:transcriptional regulator with XRE-family HTH domain
VAPIIVPGRSYPEGALIDDSYIDGIFKEVGDALRHIRLAQRVPMVELAEMVNMSAPALSRIERGARNERGLRQLYVVSGLLGVRLSDVFRFSESWAMEGKGPWPAGGSNSPLVEAILSTSPG